LFSNFNFVQLQLCKLAWTSMRKRFKHILSNKVIEI